MKTICRNMNHGRSVITLRYCPSCGIKINAAILTKCNAERHASLRKSRLHFCSECGVKL